MIKHICVLQESHRRLGENLYPNLFFYQFGAIRKVPTSFGLTIKIPRLKRQTGIVASVHANSYGVVLTSPSGLCSEFVSGTLAKFAGVYSNSDIALMTTIGDPTELAIRDIARDMALQMDEHCADTLSASTKGYQVRASNTASGSLLNESIVKVSDIIRMVTRLQMSNNPRPADGAFPLLLHPSTLFDIQSTLSSGYSGAWNDVNKYASEGTVEKIYRGEVGKLYGAKVITTTSLPRCIEVGGMSAGQSGWIGFMFAPEAYYIAEHDNMTPRTIVKGLGSAGAYDPDNSLSTVAAKVFFQCIPGFQSTNNTPNEYRYIRFPHGSTINNE